jgi:hypothetical protein
LASSRGRVQTSRGEQDLTLKGATANGRSVRKQYLKLLFKDSGWGIAGQTRLTRDLSMKGRSRREAIFLGVQSAMLIASKFKTVLNEDWIEFRTWLFKRVYEVPNISSFAKEIKEFAKALQNHALQNMLMKDPSGDFMRMLGEDLGKRIYQQLLTAGIDLMVIPQDLQDPVKRRHAAFVTAELCQTRYLPGPSLKEVMEELASLKERLAGPRDFVATKEAYDALATSAYFLGSELTTSKMWNPKKALKSSHLSLSNSGCIEYTRSQGGKFAILQNEFLEFIMEPVKEHFGISEWVPDIDDEIPEWEKTTSSAGSKGSNESVVAYRDLMGNFLAAVPHGDLPIWKVAYLSTPIEGEFRESYDIVDEDDRVLFKAEKGIDSRLGALLFLWSTVEHKKWKANGSPPLPVDPVPISEPGVKARIATKSRVWINLYLSPAGHVIKDIMQMIPGSRVGLTGSDHAWNYEASFGRHADKWGRNEIEAISTSDLTAATDYLEHGLAEVGLKRFLDGVGTEKISYRDYLDLAIELHCSPRVLIETPSAFKRKTEIRFSKAKRRYDKTPVVETCAIGAVTQRGVLMGEPIAKCVLTLMSLAAERSARANHKTPTSSVIDFAKSSRKRHLYACAGDDHIGIGSVSYLKAIPERLALWSGVVNWEKYGISKTLAHYCQDWLLKPEPRPTYNVRETGPIFKIDMIHLRLFSDRRKTGPSSFEEPNPLPGKISALAEELSWFKGGAAFDSFCIFLAKIGLGRWFGVDVLKNPMSYVPKWYGGLGLPAPKDLIEKLPDHIQYAIEKADDPSIRKLAGGVSSRRVRGIIVNPHETEELFAAKLGIQVYNEKEVFAEEKEHGMFDNHPAPSITSTRKSIVDNFVPLRLITVPEKKISAMAKAFDEDGFSQREFLTYGQRQRRVVAGFKEFYKAEGYPLPDTEVVRKNLALYPGAFELYVRRTDLESVIPQPLLPSLTISDQTMAGGSAFGVDLPEPKPLKGSLPTSIEGSEETLPGSSSDETLSWT